MGVVREPGTLYLCYKPCELVQRTASVASAVPLPRHLLAFPREAPKVPQTVAPPAPTVTALHSCGLGRQTRSREVWAGEGPEAQVLVQRAIFFGI